MTTKGLKNVIESTNQATQPPSFIITKKPGIGVITTLKEMFPDAETLVIDHEMAKTDLSGDGIILQLLIRNVEKMIVLDIDAPECVISAAVGIALKSHIDDGGRLMIATSGRLTIESEALKSRMFLINIENMK